MTQTEQTHEGSTPNTNRWGIAAARFLMQMVLGAVYAWSVFRVPLVKQIHWSIGEVTLAFTISIFVLGVSAFLGGLWLNKKGPPSLHSRVAFFMGLVSSWQASPRTSFGGST
jgi:OFA family oxalate/formate antiporter-like MFS transporter